MAFFDGSLVQTENDFSLVAHSGFAVPCKRRGRKVLCHKFGVEMKARAGDIPIYSPGADVFLRNEIHDPACNVVLEALNDNLCVLMCYVKDVIEDSSKNDMYQLSLSVIGEKG